MAPSGWALARGTGGSLYCTARVSCHRPRSRASRRRSHRLARVVSRCCWSLVLRAPRAGCLSHRRHRRWPSLAPAASPTRALHLARCCRRTASHLVQVFLAQASPVSPQSATWRDVLTQTGRPPRLSQFESHGAATARPPHRPLGQCMSINLHLHDRDPPRCPGGIQGGRQPQPDGRRAHPPLIRV